MKYFVAILPMRDAEKSRKLRPEHLVYLDRKEREGKIWARGRFVDGSGGLVIYKAESLEEVEKITAADPYVSSGARGLEIHEWEIDISK